MFLGAAVKSSGEISSLMLEAHATRKINEERRIQEPRNMCLAYSKMRDLDKKPYSPDEANVSTYLTELTGIGGGNDPVGFLITSHFELARQLALLKAKYPGIFHEIAHDMQLVDPMSEKLAERVSRLVEGMSTDTNEPLGDEDLL
jgi:hypothetical protein